MAVLESGNRLVASGTFRGESLASAATHSSIEKTWGFPARSAETHLGPKAQCSLYHTRSGGLASTIARKNQTRANLGSTGAIPAVLGARAEPTRAKPVRRRK